MLEQGHLLREKAPSAWSNSGLKLWSGVLSPGFRFFHHLGSGFGYRHRHLAKVTGLGLTLISLQTGNPAKAQAMARGERNFAHSNFTGMPADIFDQLEPGSSATAKLFNLSWLPDFVASDNELHRLQARSLIVKWASRISFRQAPDVLSRALISLSLAAPFLTGKRPSAFAEPLCAITEKLITLVATAKPKQPGEKLQQVLSLYYASLAFRTSTGLRDHATDSFCTMIDRVILPDGGHYTRNPQALVQVLLDMIPLRTALLAHSLAVPQTLTAAIERMVPMLRLLCHGDTQLCHFQGGGAVQKDWIKAIFAQDKTMGKPLNLAPHSGYCRITHKSTNLVMDFGPPTLCNSPLAFEFSEGNQRLLINCGMPATQSQEWHKAATDIAAHNTLELEGYETSASLCGAEVLTSPQGSLIQSVRTIGARQNYRHERQIFLSTNGRDLRGEDRLSLPPDAASLDVTLRFHLHPAVRTSLVRAGSKVVLLLPNRNAWNFIVSGAELDLEESITLAGDPPYRKSAQIVIRTTMKHQHPIKWALQRIEKTSPEENSSAAPELPF